MINKAWLLGIVLTVGTPACGKSNQSTDTLPSAGDKTAQRDSEGVASDPDPDLAVTTVSSVDIDARLAELCGITDVYFKYDSATLSESAKQRLDSLAACLTTGPAKDKDLIVVGRASPPGTSEHNMDLSESRAESVAKYLRSVGVNRSRVEIMPRGEEGATADTSNWPLERRVTLQVKE